MLKKKTIAAVSFSYLVSFMEEQRVKRTVILWKAGFVEKEEEFDKEGMPVNNNICKQGGGVIGKAAGKW